MNNSKENKGRSDVLRDFEVVELPDLRKKTFADERIVRGIQFDNRKYGQLSIDLLGNYSKSLYKLAFFSINALFSKYNGHEYFIYGVHFIYGDSYDTFISGAEPGYINCGLYDYVNDDYKISLYDKPPNKDTVISIAVAFFDETKNIEFLNPDKEDILFMFLLSGNQLQLKINYKKEYSDLLVHH